MTGQHSSPDDNYDRLHDLYHRHAVFHNRGPFSAGTNPLWRCVILSASTVCRSILRHVSGSGPRFSASGSLKSLPAETLSPSYRGTPQWLIESRLVKILSATGDVYISLAPGFSHFAGITCAGVGDLPRHYAVCLLECNRQMALWTTICRACRLYRTISNRPGMSVIPFAPIQSPH